MPSLLDVKITKIKSMQKWFTGFLQLLPLESTIEFSTFGNDPAVGNVHGNTRNYDHSNIRIISNCWIIVKSGNLKPVGLHGLVFSAEGGRIHLIHNLDDHADDQTDMTNI